MPVDNGKRQVMQQPGQLVEAVRQHADTTPDAPAFTFYADGDHPSAHWSYADLDRRCRAVAASLQQRELMGERVLLTYPPGLEFIAAFLGCLYAGVVAVPTYPPRRHRAGDRFTRIARDARPAAVLTDRSLAERVDPASLGLPWWQTDRIDLATAEAYTPVSLALDAVAMLQYTSGSTGQPRGVIVTHGNLAHNSAVIGRAFATGPQAMGVTWLPPYHDMGLIGALLQTVYCGGLSIVLPPMAALTDPMRWLVAISRHRATISGGPDFIYDLCVRKITPAQRRTLDLSSWQVAFNGAEPIRAQTLDHFAETFADCGFRREAFLPCYGLAEATLMVSGVGHRPPQTVLLDAVARPSVSCGPVVADHRVVIVDPQTLEALPDGSIGEIWTAGPSVAAGYFDKHQETQQTFAAHTADGDGPFLRTGDLGCMHRGELHCTGRLKDLIIVRGMNHYPQDLELTARHSHPLLTSGDGAAFTLEADGAPRLVLVHEVERNGHRDFADVLDAIATAIAAEHGLTLDGIVLIRARTLARTTSGKVQRSQCAAALQRDELKVIARRLTWRQVAPPQPAFRAHEALDAVLRTARRLATGTSPRIDGKTPLLTLGLDSLQRLELIAEIEKVTGLRLPNELVSDAETLGDLAAAVERHAQAVRAEKAKRNGHIPAEHYDPAAFPEVLQLARHREALLSLGAEDPYFHTHEGQAHNKPVIDGRAMINFCSYDYLGFAQDGEVVAAAAQAGRQYGTSASASRLVFGEKSLHGELESELAQHYGVDAALAFVSGHATNVTVIGHLFDHRDLILHDALAHNSIVQGAVLSGAERRAFAHNDWREVDVLLASSRKKYRRVLIAIEGIYSMDGDAPDLPRFVELRTRHRAMLLVDEAHALGTTGRTGRGTAEAAGIDGRQVDLWMGTLSKTLAACGGYIAGSRALVDYLRYTAPGFVYSVGLSPMLAAAALTALRKLHAEPGRVEQLGQRVRLFRKLARQRGIDTGALTEAPVVPVVVGRSLAALQLTERLAEREINVSPILYPAVPEHAARLRFFITVHHTPEHITQAVDALAEAIAEVAAPVVSR